MHEEIPKYATLRDYVALVRRQRVVILVVSAVFALAALGVSLTQSPSYTAGASVIFRDISQDLTLLNQNGGLQEPPSVIAAREASLITGPDIARRAQQILKSDIPPSTLAGSVSASVGIQTAIVGVNANWDNAAFAAKLANAFAQAAVSDATQKERQRIQSGIKALRIKISSIPRNSITRQFNQSQLSQLQAVLRIMQPAEVVERATAPAAPTSPRPLRNTVLGLIVGIAFGLVAAFARDSLDRKIRASRDAHEEFGFPILGRVGKGAFGSAGLAGSGPRPITTPDIESFRLLRTNLAFFDADHPPRTVLVTSGIAGEGKSTVAASLASASVAAGQRTLLVDADLRRPMIDQRLQLARSPGLAEYLLGTATPKDILQLRSLAVNGARPASAPGIQSPEGDALGADQLVCIASGQPPERSTELLASDRCRKFLEQVSKVYDLVVIDSSPILASVDPLEVIPNVDAILICVRIGWTTREEARAVKGALARLPERPTGLVVTGLRAEGSEYGYYGYDYSS